MTLTILPRFALAGEMFETVGAGLFTVNPPASNPDPPTGGPFVTVTSRPPAAAVDAIDMLAVICVRLVTVKEFTVTSEPSVNALVPEMNPVPVTSTSRVCPRIPLAGAIVVIVGVGFPTLNTLTRVAVPPPGGAFVTLTLRVPVLALTATVMFAIALVEDKTISEFTVMPVPKEAVVTPVAKLAPVIVTFNVCPRPAAKVLRDVKIGARFATAKAFASVDDPPPGSLFVTVTFLAPDVVVAPIVMPAVR